MSYIDRVRVALVGKTSVSRSFTDPTSDAVTVGGKGEEAISSLCPTGSRRSRTTRDVPNIDGMTSDGHMSSIKGETVVPEPIVVT